MIYLDSSVLLAELLGETVKPPDWLWDQDLVASRLLQYEVWARLHARGLAGQLAGQASVALARTGLFEMTEEVLERALASFPVSLRTLDALHLATAVYVRAGRPDLRLATYDHRLAEAATAIGLPLVDLTAT